MLNVTHHGGPEDRRAAVRAAEEALRALRDNGEVVEWAPAGHTVRPGTWAEQAEPTPDLIEAALRAGQIEDTIQLARHLATEAQEIHELYTAWSAALPEVLLRRGVPAQALAEARDRLAAAWSASERTVGITVDPGSDWQAFLAAVEAFVTGCRGEHHYRQELLDGAIAAWRRAHDRHLHLVAGWIDVAVQQLGEEELGSLWRELQADGIAAYGRYNIADMPWARSFPFIVQTAIEGMHGHLGGPRGRGEIDATDYGDRIELTFDPCGSGGRLQNEMRFGVTHERHDWAWNETGVCHYCVHCCVLMQLEPIDNFGYPVRVVDPPLAPRQRCRWTVYRDPADVPESAYRRVGRTKPR